MSNKAIVVPYGFDVPCMTHFCTSRARWAVGGEGAPPATLHLLCNDCLRGIVASVPGEYLPIQEEVPNETEEPDTDLKADPVSIAKQLYERKGFRELRAIAKERGVVAYYNLNKEDLIRVIAEGEKAGEMDE